MKKLLILVGKIGPKKEMFAEHIAKKLPKEDKLVLARFSDLVFSIEGEKVEIIVEGTDYKINEFDLVFFRRVGGTFLSSAVTLAVCLKKLGIKFFDTAFRDISLAGDKLTSYVRLSLAGLPTIPAYFCWHTKIEEKRKEIIDKLGLPLVAKQLSSQRGKGVFLINKIDDFEILNKDFPEGEFLFQKFYPGKKEYRLLVLKETIGSFEEKIKSPGEFRANLSLGAQEEFIDIKKMPKEMKDTAVKAAKVLDVQIAGVDILVDKNDKIWLLEVNRGPGLTYDPQISPELDSLASFFKKELNKTNNG
ncbi:ATP-grasp domain-containing protein [Patescibacteria group bacterium]|nr:ATP-grasp domain-containing protein [Patescibacteria group bacterium]